MPLTKPLWCQRGSNKSPASLLNEEILVYSEWVNEAVCFRLCQPVLCLRGGRESADGAEGRRPVIWEVSCPGR